MAPLVWTGSPALGSLLVGAMKVGVPLAIGALLLSLAWVCGSWLRHRFQPKGTRVRFRDFVHLGRMRLFIALSLAAAAVLVAFYWPAKGLPGAALQEVTVTVTTDGRDRFREIPGASYKAPLVIALTPDKAQALSQLLGGYSWRRTTMETGNRYEAGAVTVEATLLKDGAAVPFRLVATENKVFWETKTGADFICYYTDHLSLTGALVDFIG